MYPSVLWCC